MAMSDLDPDLARRIKQVTDSMPLDTGLPAGIMRRIGRRRLVQSTATVGILICAVLAVGFIIASLLPLRGSEPTPLSPATPSPTQSGGSLFHTDTGISLSLPAGWKFAAHNDLSIVDPPVVLIAGSWDFPLNGDCAPLAAIKAIPSDGALLWLYEYSSPAHPSHFPKRPANFTLGPAVPLECAGASTHVILFQDSGRFFEVEVALGAQAPPAVGKEVREALDSLVISLPTQ